MPYTPAAFRSGEKVAYRRVTTVFVIFLFLFFSLETNRIETGNYSTAITEMWLFWVSVIGDCSHFVGNVVHLQEVGTKGLDVTVNIL